MLLTLSGNSLHRYFSGLCLLSNLWEQPSTQGWVEKGQQTTPNPPTAGSPFGSNIAHRVWSWGLRHRVICRQLGNQQASSDSFTNPIKGSKIPRVSYPLVAAGDWQREVFPACEPHLPCDQLESHASTTRDHRWPLHHLRGQQALQ